MASNHSAGNRQLAGSFRVNNPGVRPQIGPLVVCVRGPSGSGKTLMIEHLVRRFEDQGVRVAYLKRSHHQLDLPDKGSGRVWAGSPTAMVLRAADRLQVTVAPGGGTAEDLLRQLPDGIDLVLLETHTPEPYPTVLSEQAPSSDDDVIARWSLPTLETDASAAAAAIAGRLPCDRGLDHAVRAAMRFHGGHACAGLVLGTRLALAGAEALGVPVPDEQKRLVVAVETDRCAVDAIQAITGCRPGRQTLRILDYGKLAGTFFDRRTERAVRVAARGDLRERAGGAVDRRAHQEIQLDTYLTMSPRELFSIDEAAFDFAQLGRPGRGRRAVCVACREEVSDGREVQTDAGPCCRPCSAAAKAREIQGRQIH
jgi:formylmethanofuran dehydrogenase subunit E